MTTLRLLARATVAATLVGSCFLGGTALASDGGTPSPAPPTPPPGSAATPAPTPARTADADDGTLRIMLAGDSITQGQVDQPTYRLYVDRELRRQGVDFDLVGSRTATRSPGGWYLDPDFDRDHFSLAGTTFAAQVPKVAVEVAREEPDVIVLELGINDLRRGATPEQVDALLKQFVDQVRIGAPEARILLLPVLSQSSVGARPGLNEDIARYNLLAQRTALLASTASSPVDYVTQQPGWDPVRGTLEGLHPNVEGEKYVAQLVLDALYEVRVLDSLSPSIFVELPPATAPPAPPPAQPTPAPPSPAT